MVAQIVRDKEGGECFGQPGNVLRCIDQRHREVSRCMQDGQAESASEDDVAGRGRSALPQPDSPGQQSKRKYDREACMENPELLEIAKAAPPCIQFEADPLFKAALFPP